MPSSIGAFLSDNQFRKKPGMARHQSIMNTFVPHAELTEYLSTDRVWDLRQKALSFRVNL
jgi:hypothetical protein